MHACFPFRWFLLLLGSCALGPDALRAYDAPPEPARLIQRIAFGSCNSPFDETMAWAAINRLNPDLWLWLGDTVYADSPRPRGTTPEEQASEVLARMTFLYERQNALPGYQRLREGPTRILGTWDDHDYGLDDAGGEFVGRAESQQRFLDFYGEPADSPRRTRPGVYAAYRFGPPGRVVQVVLLDTRYFRSPLRSGDDRGVAGVEGVRGRYVPVEGPDAMLLGAEQWRWLEAVLRQPAQVRLIVSSIQVVANDHRSEKWGNFPGERRRLLRLIRETGASGVVFLSGDRHTGELSRLDPVREPEIAADHPGYPLYDLTSSALTRSVPIMVDTAGAPQPARVVVYRNEINRHRIGTPLPYNHFGLVTVDWERAGGPEVVLALYLEDGEEVLRQRVPLRALQPDGRGWGTGDDDKQPFG